METYLTPWRKYATFTGRATRKEWWTFYLVNTAIVIFFGSIHSHGLIRLMSGGFEMSGLSTVLLLFLWAAVLPTLAAIVRRLHDTGRTGWWVLLGFVPVIGGLVLLIMLLFDSQPGPNQYGPNPKGIAG